MKPCESTTQSLLDGQLSWMGRIGDLTGKDVSGLEQKAKGLRAAGQVQEIGNELAALASTLQ
jgi:hypothetical protein